MNIAFNRYFLSVIDKVLNVKSYEIIEGNFLCHLVLIKSFLFGHRLISLGYLTDGGILPIDTSIAFTDNNQQILLEKIEKIALENKVDFIEFRGGIKPNIDNIVTKNNFYANFIKDFSDIDDILLSIPRKKRADIRKALKDDKLKFIDNVCTKKFYQLFCKSQHQHGTPVHHYQYFKRLAENKDYAQIFGIECQKKLVATCMVFFTDTQLIAYYGAADCEYVKNHVYDLLYYHLMCHAREKNLSFNFGRSKFNTGSFKYKTLWGFEPLKTAHYFWQISNKPLPDLRSNNPKFSKKIALWKKMPLWFVNIIGAYVLKEIG